MAMPLRDRLRRTIRLGLNPFAPQSEERPLQGRRDFHCDFRPRPLAFQPRPSAWATRFGPSGREVNCYSESGRLVASFAREKPVPISEPEGLVPPAQAKGLGPKGESPGNECPRTNPTLKGSFIFA